jgi:hypothetical protein
MSDLIKQENETRNKISIWKVTNMNRDKVKK